MKKVGVTSQYLTLQDISPQSDTKVIKGYILEKQGQLRWIEVEDQVVPARTIIQAGSVIEKTDVQVKRTPNAFVDAGEKRHFNLESVFDKPVEFFSASPKEGIPGQPAILADVLRAHGLQTFESIVANEVGYEPFIGDSKKKRGAIKAQDLIKIYVANADEFQGLMEASKKIVEGYS